MKNKISPYDLIDFIKVVGNKIRDMQDNIEFISKDDGSPVTKADKMASEMIIEFLSKLTPDIPVISEEEPEDVNLENAKSSYRWIVDPLDGTRSYIKGHDGYGCHIALVKDEKPIMGIVYFPSLGELYFNEIGGKAYKQINNDEPFEISVIDNNDKKLRASIGWADNVADIMGHEYDPVCAVGGARICVTAEGLADIAWLNKHFSQWDVAAAHAIINAAGGNMQSVKTGAETTYKQDRLHVDPMIAGSKKTLARVRKKPVKIIKK